MAVTRLHQIFVFFVLAIAICRCAAAIEDEEDAVYRALIPRLMSRVDNLESEFSKQKMELQESKATQARLEMEIQKLKATLEEQHTSNQALRDQVVGNTKRHVRLQRHMAIIRNKLRTRPGLKIPETERELYESSEQIIEKEKGKTENAITHMIRNSSKIYSQPADVLTKVETMAAPLRNKRFVLAESGVGVAFSVYLDHDLDQLGPNQPILFNKVLLNEGNAYSVHTGGFTCPTDGVYLFSFTIATVHGSQIYVKLTVNSVNMVDGIADFFHHDQDIHGGNLAILKLTQGDIVIVEVIGGTHLEGSTSLRYTTFSGALLYTYG